jgi:CSLREA domain-containing protein
MAMRGRFGILGTMGVCAAALALLPAAAGAATITVDTTADDALDAVDPGACSLREATQIAVSNVEAGLGCMGNVTGALGDDIADTIELGAGTYPLTLPSTDENANANGDIDVGAGGPITIRGEDSVITTALDDRIFDLTAAASDLTLEDLTVGGGSPSGESGGNIFANVPGNALTLRRVQVLLGEAVSGGGVAVGGAGSTFSMFDSYVADNTVRASGGGVVLLIGASGEIRRSTIELNRAESPFANADVSGGGLAQFGSSTPVTIIDSEFLANEVAGTHVEADTARGGGVATAGKLTVSGSLFADNMASSAGAAGPEFGGGLAAGANSHTARITNSTFHGNLVGDLSPNGEGGAIHQDGNAGVVVSHVTFDANTAVNAAPAGDHLHGDGTNLLVSASVLPTDAFSDDACFGVVSEGFNSANPDAGGGCGFVASDSVSAAPVGLAPGGLQDNGGPTGTIALAAGSRALDLVPAAACAPTAGVDQRGAPRPQGAGCDAGAFELPCTAPSTLPGCPPLATSPTAKPGKCAAKKKGKPRKRCLCKQRKGKQARKKCLRKVNRKGVRR